MTTNEHLVDDTSDQIQVRLAKRAKLLAEGHEPYAAELPITHVITDVRGAYAVAELDDAGEPVESEVGDGVRVLVPGEETEDQVALAGRVMLMRPSGRIAFVVLQDGAGNRLQVI
ncbi:MAG: lysine--tRNA ligase, partial [Actinomycetaceae bacterium]|nr:lysine--tRNA ligase [Actinomycetaceae bacterium]